MIPMVEIIPKPISKPSVWKNIFVYISIFLLIGVFSIYLILANSYKNNVFILESINKDLVELKTQEEKDLEGKVLEKELIFQDFLTILNNHKKTSKFFKYLETNSHPQVQFLELNLDSTASKAEILGQTDNFQNLGQQLLIFQKAEDTKKVNLSDLFIEKEGKVEFTLNLYLKPELFK